MSTLHGRTFSPLVVLAIVLMLVAAVQPTEALDPGRIRYIDSTHVETPNTGTTTVTSLNVSFSISECSDGDYRYLVAPLMWHNPADPTVVTPADAGDITITWDCDGAGSTCSPVSMEVLTSDCTNDGNDTRCVGIWGLGINQDDSPQDPDPHDTDEPPATGSGVVSVSLPTTGTSDQTDHELVLGAIQLCGVSIGDSLSTQALISANVGKNNTTVDRGLIQVDTADGAMAIDLLAVPVTVAHTPDYSFMAEMFGQSGAIADTASICTHSSRIASTLNVTYSSFTDQQPTRYNFSPNSTYVLALAVFAPFSPTSVDFDHASVHPVEGRAGAVIRWRTGYDEDNIGFRIHRDDGSGHVAIGPALVPGNALTSPATRLEAGSSFAWYDPHGDEHSVYWIEDIDRSGKTTLHGPFHVMSSTDRVSLNVASRVAADARKLGTADQGWIRQRTVAGPGQPTKNIAATENRPSSAFGTADGVRMTVVDDGLYTVTYEDLLRAGFDAGAVETRYLQLWIDGAEADLLVDDGGDRRLDPGDSVTFFGKGTSSMYASGSEYWLIEGDRQGQRIQPEKMKTERASRPGVFRETVERTERLTHIMGLINGDAENFFGQIVLSDPVHQAIELAHPITVASNATVRVALQGLTTDPHTVDVSVNGTMIGSIEFQSDSHETGAFGVPPSLLGHGSNTVTITPREPGAGVSAIDWIQVSYPRSTIATRDTLDVTLPGSSGIGRLQPVHIDGFTTPDIRILEVSNPLHPRVYQADGITSANGYGLSVNPEILSQGWVGGSRVIATTASAAKKPEAISLNQPSSWFSSDNGADLVVIGTPTTLAGLGSLVAHRQSQGLTVETIDINDLYDEFTYGTKSPWAVRDFLTRAASHWDSAPKYVLLAGDASYDPRDYLGFGQDIVPTSLLEIGDFETAADGWFTEDLPAGSLALGRIPVRTLEQAQAAAAKIIGYDASGVVLDEVLLVADTAEGQNFATINDNFASDLPATVGVETLEVEPIGAAAARIALHDHLNAGVPFIQYSGHGSIDLWNAGLLTAEDAPTLQNSDHLGIYTVMSCLNGMFHEPLLDGLGEALFTSPGGAVAVLASSAKQDTLDQEPVISALHQALFGDSNVNTLGDAIALALTNANNSARRSWVLIGDPSTPIAR